MVIAHKDLMAALRVPGRRFWGWTALWERLRTLSPLAAVLDYIPEGSRLCDIGCGGGTLMLLASRLRKTAFAHGYDISFSDVVAVRPYSDAQPKLAATLLSPGQRPDLAGYDVVTLVDVLRFLPVAGQSDFIKGLVETMSPGARLVIVDIDSDVSFLRLFVSLLLDGLLFFRDTHPISVDNLQATLSSLGMTVTDKVTEDKRPLSTLLRRRFLVAAVR